MTRVQIMAVATAIAQHECEVFGDHCLITNLTRIIREELARLEPPAPIEAPRLTLADEARS